MDDSVFHRLYEEYHQDVFKFLIYLTRNRDQAEDLMHEVYVRVLKAYANFEGKSSEKTWLFSIAKNVAMDHFRKQTVRRKYAFDKFDWEKSELPASEIPPEEVLLLSEKKQSLLKALNTCTGDQKLVIQMRFMHDLTIAETADVLDWSEGKVKTTQHRAIRVLRQKLTSVQIEGGEVDG